MQLRNVLFDTGSVKGPHPIMSRFQEDLVSDLDDYDDLDYHCESDAEDAAQE